MITTAGLVLIMNTTMILCNLTVLMVNGSQVMKEMKKR
jgi:hypothetical protein